MNKRHESYTVIWRKNRSTARYYSSLFLKTGAAREGANVGRTPARGERAEVWLTQSKVEAIVSNALSVWAYESGPESR